MAKEKFTTSIFPQTFNVVREKQWSVWTQIMRKKNTLITPTSCCSSLVSWRPSCSPAFTLIRSPAVYVSRQFWCGPEWGGDIVQWFYFCMCWQPQRKVLTFTKWAEHMSKMYLVSRLIIVRFSVLHKLSVLFLTITSTRSSLHSVITTHRYP